jgi:NADPH:quinone reductase-like Zn-dependent oxidoreductase
LDRYSTTALEHGSYAEHVVLLAEATTHKPPQVSFVQAVALPVAGGTAWDALEKLGVTKGETLLINGVGGGLGVMAAQVTRNRGAAVFGAGSPTKRSMTEKSWGHAGALRQWRRRRADAGTAPRRRGCHPRRGAGAEPVSATIRR